MASLAKVDLRAVKAASRADLLACARAAARNGQGLLRDAELLAAADARARAYSLAAFAVEECGKAMCLAALAVLPRSMRTRAPVGKMLQWHQLKQVGGLLVAAVSIEPPGLAAKLAAMPEPQVTQILSALGAPADQADRLKRRGLYVDMDRVGRVREPSEITGDELASQLAQARQAARSAALVLSPAARDRLSNPPAEVVHLAVGLASALAQAGSSRTPDSAAEVVRQAVSGLRHAARPAAARPAAARPADARPADAARPAAAAHLARDPVTDG